MSITHENYNTHGDQYTVGYEANLNENWLKWFKSTKSTTKELELFFRLRADLEEEYSNKLIQLTKLPFGYNEKGSLQGALGATLRELEVVANDHIQLANKIRTELQEATGQAYQHHKQNKKNLYKNLETKVRERDGFSFMLERARERVLEFQQIGNDAARYGADQELRLSQARFEDSENQLYLEKEKISNGHRNLEVNRVQFIRNILWRYTNLISSTCVTDDESLEKIRRELEKCDSKAQVEDLLEAFQSNTYSYNSDDDSNNSNTSQNNNQNLYEKQNLNNLNNIAVPEKSSPLRNEIRKSQDPKLNQLASSLAGSEMNSHKNYTNNNSPVTPITNEKSKLISSDLVSATIARSPILAAKRSSTGSRPVSRTPTIPSNLGNNSPAQFSSPNPSTQHGYDSPRSMYNLERSGSNSSKHSQNGKIRSISPPEEFCPSPNNLQRSFSTIPNQSYLRQSPHPHPHSQSVPLPHSAPYSPANNNYPINYYHPDQRVMTISPPNSYSPAHTNIHSKPNTNMIPAPQFQMQPTTPRNNNQIPLQQQQQQLQQQPQSQTQPQPQSQPQQINNNNNNNVTVSTLNGNKTNNNKNSTRPDSRPILFYVKAMYDYEAEISEEISLVEGQIISVLATQLDGWWEGEVQDNNGTYLRGIFPSNFTEPVSL
ncbi:hypothetical protein K502DRAFT_322480 [Neoconidiobolus thromboides FSU 785]|nr:hypothetical protein K502DRAFT_322480 [Neoconidiobolus thromboides FSU 785]